jgi:uncharacterized OsmC-like protein
MPPHSVEIMMLDYLVNARRVDDNGSVALAKAAEITLDTGLSDRPDAFNPAELFLASIAACMIKGIERVVPLLKFELRGVEVKLRAIRQDSPPKIVSVEYEIIVDTDEEDRRLELLHGNVRKYGTISNTVAEATKLEGILRRRVTVSSDEAAEHQAEIERVAEISRKQLDGIPAPGTDVFDEGRKPWRRLNRGLSRAYR